MMYHKILVPLDGSKRAEAILPHVEYLASRHGSRVIFLQVIEPRPLIVDGVNTGFDPVEYEERHKAAESYMNNRQNKFREQGIEAKYILVSGPIVEEIINAAEREEVDLIAMASHGRTGLAHVFYGSVAAGVLHRIDRPLLLIRSDGDD